MAWLDIKDNLILLCISYLLALPIGWNREKKSRSAGIRTFPLVSLSACAYMLIGTSVADGGESFARLLYGLMTGIGFIGGGAIVKSKHYVHGTATAAGIWCTGAIGAAVSIRRFEIAVLLSVVTIITFFGKNLLSENEV